VKLLLDACVWGGASGELRVAGHDVIWAGDWSEDPGDQEILTRANREGRILVTLDKDFGELAVLHAQEHSGVLRIVDFRAGQQGPVCLRVLALHGDMLLSGAIVTAEPGRIRVRPPAGSDGS
jgi:predicted nuclease of predicted toxin-antitoxin system